MADNTSSVPVQKNTDSPQIRDDEKELVNSILQDTEDLGHRLLSMSQYLWISHARISLYTADELVTTTSRLKKISMDFYKAAEEAVEEKRKEEKERDRMRKKKDAERDQTMLTHEFLRLSSSVLARPNLYKNELAMMFTVEDEEEYERVMEAEREMERQRENCRRRRRKKRPPKKPPIVEVEHAADEQETKSQTEQLKEWMDDELEFFAGHRSIWERSNGSKSGRCGGFEDKTTLSPMQFTHCIPGIIPPRAAVTGSTLQIYSFKIVELSDDLKWPLRVYGVVAARDTVDRNRNLLFARSRIRCQVLTENDSSLCLTGPSRAILAVDPVDFEVELKIHDGGDERKDRELIWAINHYDIAYNGEQPSLTFHSPLCRAELRLERLPTTVQATILSVHVVGGGSLFKSGGQVFCSSSSADSSAARREKIVLLDYVETNSAAKNERHLDGYLPLSRNVVSVEFGGGLEVVVKVYGGSGCTCGHVYFPFQYCNISQGTCSVSGSEVEIVVAWSRLVGDKMDMLIEGYTTQA
ncbi:hypothetical protein CFC21_026918 [Triticum aestivum]|uniref:DUF6598 domain-containing protein n=3 Tax=Triticum aestivum TaxID=4565 RepID=A0A9R1JD80_WHEAT|nr:hypothetical protein CFC21_026918 [Triticum aestivum]